MVANIPIIILKYYMKPRVSKLESDGSNTFKRQLQYICGILNKKPTKKNGEKKA